MTPLETLREAARQARENGTCDDDRFTLAVADWLDVAANEAETTGHNNAWGHTFHALTTARTYLGRSS